MRLNKYLSHAGIDSRRKCDEFIKKGQVKVNGLIMKDFSYQVTDDDVILCKNKIVEKREDYVIYLLNKPKGFVCTNSTEQTSKRVIDLIPNNRRLYTVGRLDRDTTGAIILTDNGDLANQLMHPKFQKEKIYIVETKIDIPFDKYSKLKKGIKLDHGEIAYGNINRLSKEKNKIYWKVILKEGKNQEVKRIFAILDSKVENLHRSSFSGMSVDNIKIGQYKIISKKSLKLK